MNELMQLLKTVDAPMPVSMKVPRWVYNALKEAATRFTNQLGNEHVKLTGLALFIDDSLPAGVQGRVKLSNGVEYDLGDEDTMRLILPFNLVEAVQQARERNK